MIYSNNSSTKSLRKCLACALLSLPAFAGNPIPAEIPPYDGAPPATDKPVKIYIFSGQSNSLGFGRPEGGDLPYSSILLSADPKIKATKMPTGSAGVLPHYVFTSENGPERGAIAKIFEGDYAPEKDYSNMTPIRSETVALGDVKAQIPFVSGHTTVVEGFIEVPMTGMHELHSGYGDSEYAVVKVNGQKVYSKLSEKPASISKIKLEAGQRHPVRIAYTKGGQAAFWMEVVGLKPKGSLRYMIEEHGQFTHLVDDKGEWIVRGDAHVNNTFMGKGKDVPYSPVWRGNSFGPEVGFGSVLATYHDEPVIFMKVDIGNRSLGWDILPPGTETRVIDGKTVPGYGMILDKAGNAIKAPPGRWYAGKQYDEYTKSIHHVLDNFEKIYPQYAEQGYEIAGFVWWQGHKDQNDIHASLYAENFANLVKAWGREFDAEDAPWVLATIAFEGWALDGAGKKVAEAQLSVDGDAGVFPGHKGKVKTIEARDFWRRAGDSPKNQGYHYNHNGETYYLVGDALGRAMVELKGGKVEPRVHRQYEDLPESWPEEPSLAEAAQMLYTQEFMSPWAKGPNKPTKSELAAMAPAFKPFIIGSQIPHYIDTKLNIGRHIHKGTRATTIVSGDADTEDAKRHRNSIVSSSLDGLISLYNTVGIDDYDWKDFGPEMHLGEWHYYSFTPSEPVTDKFLSQYREVKMPAGMENWYAVDFDAKAAGWKTGQAPFGQKNGKQVPLRSSASPLCRSDVTPNTLWENDALFIRQTFEIPLLQEGHRYRLVVGGGNGAFAGEGYAVYINGKLFSEETSAKFKEGGISGRYFLDDFVPELESGEITVAVKSFLRRAGHKGKAAPPEGHLSVWLQEAKMPALLLEKVEQSN
ncbi:MAG: sialate O-acetylesterase [Opitutales bacterium]